MRQDVPLKMYVNFKTLLNPEKYLSIAIPFNLRKSLACFRCSSHKLNIEIGRHYGIDKEDRICLYCFINEDNLIIEDEYHVFFNCLRYDICLIRIQVLLK